MGIGCGRGPGLHLSDDLLIIEPVDEANQPVPVGHTSSKVLLTSLYNPALPLVRYELTDEITMLADRCPCGSEHRLIADPHGRLDDSFRYDVTVVHPLVFRSILGSDAGIIEYQVHQTRAGADVAIRGHADPELVQQAVIGALRRAGLPAPEVTVAVVPDIPRQDTGKVRRFLPCTRE